MVIPDIADTTNQEEGIPGPLLLIPLTKSSLLTDVAGAEQSRSPIARKNMISGGGLSYVGIGE